MRNANGEMFVSSTNSLENEFLYKMAIGDGSEEDLGGETGPSLNTSMEGDELAPLQEGQEVKDALDAPDNEIAETIGWDNFSVDISSNFASKLQDKEQQGLAPEDADKKSYFIKYVEPDTGKIYGVMGPMFGKDRENGVGQSWVGGYETDDEAQEDLHKMKTTWDNFPEDRNYMLVELSQLSPDLASYEKQKQEELPDLVDEQEKDAEEADKEDTEVEEEADKEAGVKAPAPASSSKPQPSVPRPIGKVPAHIMNYRLRAESRIQRLKTIKG